MKKVSLILICLLLTFLPANAKSVTDKDATDTSAKVFIYHIPDDNNDLESASDEVNSDKKNQDKKIITSDDITADTSGKVDEDAEEDSVDDEDVVEDYELGDMYTDVLKGYAEYNEEDENSIFLEDDLNDVLALNIKKPSKVSDEVYSGSDNLFFKSPEIFTKYNKVEYSIAPVSNVTTTTKGNFSIGTTYNQGIDYAEFEQTTGIFSRYDTKYFAVSSAYKKTINSTNNNYNDKFYFAPEIKINQYFTLRETLSADIVKNIRQAEFTISINPFGRKDLDRLKFELGTNSIFDGTNTLLKNQFKIQTNLKL